jgi:DnaJ family protein B protein 12
MTVIHGNKDESDRCIEIAVSALKAGNIERAEKFLNKADNLYPSQKAKNLLAQIKAGAFSKFEKKENSPEPKEPTGPRKRTVPEKPEEHKLGVDYTSDQVEIVHKIKKCKDYYEVLGVTKEATDSEIKKVSDDLVLNFLLVFLINLDLFSDRLTRS